MEECSRCKFFKNRQGPGKMGDCRRYPMYIERKPSQWCGEFERDPRLVRVHQPNAAGNRCPECHALDSCHTVTCSIMQTGDVDG